MAEAKLLEAKKPDVELILTYDEAEFLFRLLMNHISGSGSNMALSDSIYYSLNGLQAKFKTQRLDNQMLFMS